MAVELTIKNVLPLAPIKVDASVLDESTGTTESPNIILFLDQVNGHIYDLDGRVNEAFEQSVLGWITKKNEEVQKQMAGRLMTATPEQLRSMGIDVNDTNKKIPKIIV